MSPSETTSLYNAPILHLSSLDILSQIKGSITLKLFKVCSCTAPSFVLIEEASIVVTVLTKLEQEIGYTFKDKNLLQTALTHTSYAYERKTISNEKLEFLGDSILEFLSSIYIYQNYPKLKEGEMTKVRAQVVCEASLYKVAKSHNFSDFLRLGKSQNHIILVISYA